MEEGSIAFTVDGAEEEDGSDEEEERQRKEELHQLLTEQLQDELLDDSVSTVTTEDGAADSTLLREEVGVSLDHVISPNQSCDLSPAAEIAPENEMVSADHTSQSGCGQTTNGCGQTEVSDVFSGTAQAYSVLTDSQPTLPAAATENHTHQEVTSHPGGRGQLEVLYGARCRQVMELTRQLQEAREGAEHRERVLRHEKREMEAKLGAELEELQNEVVRLSRELSETSAAMATIQGERAEVCAMLHPKQEGEGEVAKRLVILSAEKEDLQYQLSCCQGQLDTLTQRAEDSEGKVLCLSEELESERMEVERLRVELESVERERERDRVTAATDKREALEKCRAVCLQLHEDASVRLREGLLAERESLLLQQTNKMAALQVELSSAQEEYVRVCGEKEKLEMTLTQRMEQTVMEWKGKSDQLLEEVREKERERERAVLQAVERAREGWRETLTHESRESVEKALRSARQQWQARLAAEQETMRKRAEETKELAVRAALETARTHWQAQQKLAIQSAVEKGEREIGSPAVEPVLTHSEVQSLIQNTVSSVKKDVRKMLGEVMRQGREREEKAVAECRIATAQQMKAHYLSCLHMMVNSLPPGAPPNGVHVRVQSSTREGRDSARSSAPQRMVGSNRNSSGSKRAKKRVPVMQQQGQRSQKQT